MGVVAITALLLWIVVCPPTRMRSGLIYQSGYEGGRPHSLRFEAASLASLVSGEGAWL